MKFDNHGVLQMTPINYDINRPAADNPIKIQDCSFRDGHQSLFATRGRTEDMIPMAQMMDEVGFHKSICLRLLSLCCYVVKMLLDIEIMPMM